MLPVTEPDILVVEPPANTLMPVLQQGRRSDTVRPDLVVRDGVGDDGRPAEVTSMPMLPWFGAHPAVMVLFEMVVFKRRAVARIDMDRVGAVAAELAVIDRHGHAGHFRRRAP